MSSSPCIYFSNDLTFPFLPHTACTFFLPLSTKISCSTLLFHIRTSLLVKYSGIVTVLIFLYSSLYLELLILSYRSYLCNLFLPLSVSLLYGLCPFLFLLSVFCGRTVSLKEFSSLPPILTFCSFLFSFPPYNLPAISSLFLYFFSIFTCSARCLYSVFVQFCGPLLCTLVSICLVPISISHTYLYFIPFFLALFILIIPMLRTTDQHIIILVLKCLSDSFFPVANTFALLPCSTAPPVFSIISICTLLFLLYFQLYSASLLDLLPLPAIRIFDFSLFNCNFFSFSQLSNFFSIVVLFNSFSVPSTSTTSSAYASTCTLTCPLSSLFSASLHDPVPSLLCTWQIARVLMGNPTLFLASSKIHLFVACPYCTSSFPCTFLLFLFLVAPRFHFSALSCSAAFCQVSRAQPSVNALLILHFTLILQIVSFVILYPFCNFMLLSCVTLVRTVLIHNVNVVSTVA